MMTYTDKQIKELSEIRYGTDIHVFAAQRDGFIEGFKEALNEVENLRNDVVENLSVIRNNEVTLKAFIEEFIDAWEDGMGGDSDLYKKAKSLL